MKQLLASLERASSVATLGAALALIVLMVMQVIFVVLRYVFSVGVQWGQDLLVYLFMISSVLPLVYVVVKNQNVRVDVFYAAYRQATRARLDRWGLLLLFLPVSAWTSYASWEPLLNAWQIREGSATMGGLPGLYLLKTVQMVVFIALTLSALLLGLRQRPWDDDAAPHEAGE